MKWQTKTVSYLDTPLPNWYVGMDRLDWVSPYEKQAQLNLEQIANGNLSRFVVDDDRLEVTETRKILYTTFNTLVGAQTAYDFQMLYGIPTYSESVEIIERPDL